MPRRSIAAVALLLIGFSQTAGDARVFAARHSYRIGVNQETVAQGMANIGAGVFQGMPVSTSLSASSLNDSAGARSQAASLATGALVLLTLIVFAPALLRSAKAVLAAMIIDAVVFGMMDIAELRRLRRVARVDSGSPSRRSSACSPQACSQASSSASCCRWVGSLRRDHAGDAARAAARERRCSARSTRHPAMRRSPASWCCASTRGLFFATADALEEQIRDLVQADGPAFAPWSWIWRA